MSNKGKESPKANIEFRRKGKSGEGVLEKADALISGPSARLARVEEAIKAAPDESNTDALQRDLANQISDHVYFLRESGEKWNTIVESVAENFGISQEEVRKMAKPKDKNDKIGQRLAAAIIGQAQILGDASTD